MSITVKYVRVAADHIELLQKDLVDAWSDLNLNAYYPDTYPALDLILQNLPGDIEELNINDPESLAWLLSPLKREEKKRGPLVSLSHEAPWPALDLPLVAIEGRNVAIEGRDPLRVRAVDSGLGEGTAFDPTTVQKLSTALSQITPDDLLGNFDYDTMQRIGLPGFGVPGLDNEEERATDERLAREAVSYELGKLQEFYRRAAASGQYVIVCFA